MEINYVSDKKTEVKKISKMPEGKTASAARIIHNQQEFVIDFIAEETVVERVIENPHCAKEFCKKLSEAIEAYEAENGEIKIKRQKQERLINEMRRNLFFGKKAGKNLRIINPKRRNR